jgi:LytS/YehU family sensor histidine kinase
MFYNFKYYEDLQQNIRKEHELKSQLKESEFEALKAQINPHFLFNSLNSISSLCMIDSAKAQSMIINLSDFLRLSINKKNEHTTSLEEEIENMNLYLGIEKQRFGKKLNVVYHLKENTTKAIIPSMILQPIIENSIKHGVSQLTDLSDIVIRSSIKAQNLQISIENQFDPSYSAKKGTGIGIKNIRNRLVNLYDKVDLLEIEKQENKFIVKLTIPQETQNI